MPHGLPPWLTPAAVATLFVLFVLLESLRPLRGRRESRIRRLGRNLATAGLGLGTAELLQIPILLPVSRWTADHGAGLLGLAPLAGLPGWARAAIAVLLLDYTLWFWHWMNHRVPFFWRFHSVHHVDRDMDTSTALRFHFGELGMSMLYRGAQIVAIGATPVSVAIWQLLLFASILFHHSNTRLPLAFERILVRVVVTPRMHGIHHSDFRNETDTNWSSLLSVWDSLHGTLRLNVPQDSIEIGVAAFQAPDEVTLGRILVMPFVARRDDWIRENGRTSERPPPPTDPGALAS